ncbi:CDP-alcohol phosphatidyltransferase [Catovirus CTV1]|uniref:CDP-alcohol phosphatidyltransferase n=1 Tax=Catovirus CTV1 TaxID=1977631 RepID=A0A1V0SBU3_9VIRU|nr:CDP-alcohol phosphatidyltransferase [Catovirus CTV1]
MRKLPCDIDNPIDNFLINICENSSDFLKKNNFTPNILTTISLLIAIFSVILFYYDYYELAAIFFMISYFFDCCDGHFARKYNMMSKFGCYYDHVADTLKYVMLGTVMYYKSKNKFFKILPIFILLFALGLVHTGCIEIYTDDQNKSDSLSYFKDLCPTPTAPELALQYTKFFGFGTLNLVIVCLIFTFGTDMLK